MRSKLYPGGHPERTSSSLALTRRFVTGSGLLLLLASALWLIFGGRPALARPSRLAAPVRNSGEESSPDSHGDLGPSGPTGHAESKECGGTGPCYVGDFNSVGCGSTTACTAVGYGIDGALGEDWNGTSWSIDATVNPGGDGSTSLNGDWCTSSTTCIAVGYGNGAMISETRSGSGWSVQTIPLPSGDSSAYLNQVSCSSASACTAVGSQYNSTSGESTALAERWNGTSWSPQTVPMPAGGTGAELDYVWCAGASACDAVGYYDGTSSTLPLAEAWNGKAWKVQKAPLPAGGTSGLLSGLSCPSAGACEAVGYYISSAGDELTLAELQHGSSWTVQSTPTVSGASYDTLKSVSCTSTTNCMAVGQSSNGALSEQWNGTTWSVESVPAPSDQVGTSGQLNDLACPSSSTCMAVGSYEDTSDCEVTLGELWNGSAWAVQPTLSPVALTGFGLASGTVGKSYSSGVSACGGPSPYTWSYSGNLPNGLTLNTSTGVISGTPHYAGTSSFTLTVAQSSDPANTTSATESIEINSPKAPTNWPLDVAEAPPPPSGNTGPVLVNPEVAYILVGSWWCPLFGSGGPVSDPTDTACSGGSGGSAVAQSADMVALSNLVGTDYRSGGYAGALSNFYEVENGTTTYVGNFGPEPLYSPYGTVWAGPLQPGSFTINDSFLKQVASGFGLSATQAANTVFVFLYAPNLLNCSGTNNGTTSDGAYSFANVYLEDSSDYCAAGKPYLTTDPNYPTDFATYAVSHEIDEAVTDPGANPNSWIIPTSSGTWQIADVCEFRNAEGDTSPTSKSYPYFNMTRDYSGTVVSAYVAPYGSPYTCTPSSGTGVPPK